MNEMLKIGDKVLTEKSNKTCEILELLGSGGQGEVYRVKVDNSELALKWYFPHIANSEQKANLEDIIRIGAPNSKFLWPMELVKSQNSSSYGYLMPLRGKQYKSIAAYLRRKCDSNFSSIIKASYNLADSFYKLQTKGLCYQDINIGNVFFEPNTGDILICDNDNVTINNTGHIGVLGTPGFMAPEIVRKEALPSANTDLHSLAVLIFHLMFIGHPLDGEKEANIRAKDLPAMEKLYGKEPVFIFDPNDDSNRPVEGYQDNPIVFWKIYPEFFKELVTRAFTEGIKEYQHKRVRQNEWRNSLIKLMGNMVYCHHCGEINFYDQEKLKNQGAIKCWNSNTEIILPYRMKLGSSVIMLNHDSKIYSHHIKNDYDIENLIGEVNVNPKDKSIFGLKNLTQENWTTTDDTGNIKIIEPSKTVRLYSGLKINFGAIEGDVRY